MPVLDVQAFAVLDKARLYGWNEFKTRIEANRIIARPYPRKQKILVATRRGIA